MGGSTATGSVGFIGLGDIGAPMAEQVHDWPGGLVVMDARPEAVEPFVARGAQAANTAIEIAKSCRVVCVMVQTGDQVRSLLDGTTGIIANATPGTVVAIHSTISAEEASEFAELGARHGVAVLDAPVSGGAAGARQGDLAVMVGGDSEAFDQVLPVLETFGGLVHHMGPAGSGIRTKIARNLITFAAYAAVGEASRLAEASGLDVRQLGSVVQHSDAISGGAGAIMVRSTSEAMSSDDPLRPFFEHAATLASKDIQLAIQMGEELGVDVSFARITEQTLPAALGLAPYKRPSRG